MKINMPCFFFLFKPRLCQNLYSVIRLSKDPFYSGWHTENKNKDLQIVGMFLEFIIKQMFILNYEELQKM